MWKARKLAIGPTPSSWPASTHARILPGLFRYARGIMPSALATAVAKVVASAIAILLVLALVALVIQLFIKRNLGVAYIVVGGAICGVLSAVLSAPISAIFFGGVTGSGSDLLVAAFQQAGSDLSSAVLQQTLIQDPIDKTITYIVVFILLQTLSRRFVARFPQGERAIGTIEG